MTGNETSVDVSTNANKSPVSSCGKKLGVEGGPPVFGRHADPNSEVAELQVAGAMHGDAAHEGEFFARLGEDLLALALGERDVGLLVERLHGLALVAVAHPTLEGDTGARAGIGERTLQGGGIEGDGGDSEHRRKREGESGGRIRALSRRRRAG